MLAKQVSGANGTREGSISSEQRGKSGQQSADIAELCNMYRLRCRQWFSMLRACGGAGNQLGRSPPLYSPPCPCHPLHPPHPHLFPSRGFISMPAARRPVSAQCPVPWRLAWHWHLALGGNVPVVISPPFGKQCPTYLLG